MLLSLVWGTSACRDRPPDGPAPIDLSLVTSLAALPGASDSPDPELRAQIARIRREGGGPLELWHPPLPKDQNAAVELITSLGGDRLESAGPRAEGYFPRGVFQFDADRLAEITAFRRSFSEAVERVRRAIGHGVCDFGFDLRRGYFADRSFVDAVALYQRLEAFHVAEMLDAGQPEQALPSLRGMFTWLEPLALVPHVEARLAAARLRADAMSVVDQWANHPHTSGGQIRRLAILIQQQLDRWPDDALAWIGDRALALHSYELIRQGRLSLLLTQDEVERFRREGVFAGLERRLQANVDRDECFYLQSMEEIIASCRQPYFERRQRLAGLRKRLHAKRNSSSFPFAAGRLFLAGVDQAMALQAIDRERVEVWALALTRAVDSPSPAATRSPFTGVAYLIDVGPKQVRVLSGSDSKSVATVRRREP